MSNQPTMAGMIMGISFAENNRLKDRITEQRKEFVICEQKCFKQQAIIRELRECVRIGLDYIDSDSVADKFEAALKRK